MVRGGQSVGYILLTAEAVASVLRLAVNGVAGDTYSFLML